MRKKLGTRFPASRIKKIMQADEDVGKIANAVPLLVSKALELFLQDLCDRTYAVTLQRGAKTMNSLHLKQCVRSCNAFDFLSDVVNKVPSLGGSDPYGDQKFSRRRKISDDGLTENDEERKIAKMEVRDLNIVYRGRGKQSNTIDPELANAWAAGLDDGLWGNNAPAMDRVNEFLAGAGTDAPDVDEFATRPSGTYDDMWAKTILESDEAEDDDIRSSGASSPESTGSIESSISSHFGGMSSYPSLFSSQPQPKTSTSRFNNASTDSISSNYGGIGSPIREEYPSYSTPQMQRFESFDNPMAGSQSFKSENEEGANENPQVGKALYDFSAGGDDELSLSAGEDVEIDYEVDGWFYVKKKRPGRDGKMAGLVPVLYVSNSG